MPARSSAPAPGEGLLKPEEAAAYLGIPVRRMKEYVLAGEIAYVTFGPRTKRYEREALDEFAASLRERHVSS